MAAVGGAAIGAGVAFSSQKSFCGPTRRVGDWSGGCYLALVWKQYREQVLSFLGEVPTFMELLTVQLRYFRPQEDVEWYSIRETVPGVWHVYCVLNDDIQGDFLSAYSLLRERAAGGSWPDGSLGAALAFQGSSRDAPDCVGLAERVGAADWPVPIRPDVHTEEAVNAYNLALAQYYSATAADLVAKRAVVGSGGGQGLPRGPNYERNALNRLRKKAAAQVRASGMSASGGDIGPLIDMREQLAVLECERKIKEEKRRIGQLDSPVQVVRDVVSLVRLGNECEKHAERSKVAGWAATVSGSCAESLARSAPSSIDSLDSVSSARSLAQRRERVSVSKVPLSRSETAAVNLRIVTESGIENARVKVNRVLEISDFLRSDAPFKLNNRQRAVIENCEQHFG